MEKSSDHSSRTILWITVIIGIVLSVVVWPLSQLGKGGTDAGGADEAELRILPVARVEMQKAAVATDGKPRSGEAIYNTICKACHDTGVAGAPKTGDKAAWAPRLAPGFDEVLKIATQGKGAMPPKGGFTGSDADFAAAVHYMVDASK